MGPTSVPAADKGLQSQSLQSAVLHGRMVEHLAPDTDYGLWIIDPAHPGNNPDYFRLWIIDLAHPTNSPDYCRLWIITLAHPTPT